MTSTIPPEIRPEILAFAAMMERIMAGHDTKLGQTWKQASRDELMQALSSAATSLERARKRNEIPKLLEQCVDVANLSMMLAWHHHHFGTIAYDGLTERQSRTLDFIRTFIAVNGFSPTLREIKAGIKVGNLSTVQDLVEGLVRRGVIAVTHRVPRSIVILERDRRPPRKRAGNSQK